MDKPDSLIEKFISGKRLNTEEILLIENIFNNSKHHKSLYNWLERKWDSSENEMVHLSFDDIRKKINPSTKQTSINRLFTVFSRVAAIFIIPLIIAAIYLYINQSYTDKWLTLSTQNGEQTSLILPDSSEVWLNIDTKLSYPVNFGLKSRKLKLTGEAYFKVKKNEDLAFEVQSGILTTKALGTEFSVSAYPEDNQIKSSLVNGSTEVIFNNEHKILKPGQQLIYENNKLVIKDFDQNLEMAWKDAQLIFRLTPLDKVFTTLEKWYDINIEYDNELLSNETLTVRFEKDETLEHVLQVMAKANEFRYKIQDKNILISK